MAIAIVPLVIMMPGIWKTEQRRVFWSGFVVLLYFVIGVMEAWSNPPQRLPALIQTALVAAFVVSVLLFSRSFPRRR